MPGTAELFHPPFWVSPSLLVLEAAQESSWCEKHIALLELKYGFEGCDISHTSHERGPSVGDIKQEEGALLSSGRNRDLGNLCSLLDWPIPMSSF